MGATVLGAGIIAGASLAGTAATVATNQSNQSFGAGQSAAARQWSTNERLASQEYNTSERLAAQEYNTSERLAAQEYNSIPNQAMQFRSAGLNPNALANAVSFQGASPGHSQGASSFPGSTGLSGIGTAQVPNIPQLISSGADLVNALAKNSETKATLPLINEQVKNYMLKNFGQETTNSILDLEKQLMSATLPVKIKQEFELLAKLGFDKMVSEQLGKKFEQENVLMKQQEKINDLIHGLKGQELIQAQYLTERWNEIQDSIIGLNKAKTSESRASAANLSADTETKNLFNKIYGDKRYQHSLVTQAVEAGRKAVSESKISKSQAEHMNYLVEQAAYANDMKEFTYWSNQIQGFIGTIGDAATSIYGAGSLKALTQMRQSQLQTPPPIRGFNQ